MEHIGPTVVVVVTNARLIFVAPDEETDLEEWSVYYSDLEHVSIDPDEGDRLHVSTQEGVTWEATLPQADPEILDAMVRHFAWVSDVRETIIAVESEVEEAADEIRELADEREWEHARKRYKEVRNDLDELIVDVQLTTPMADETIAPELTDIERTLEDANARLYLESARVYMQSGVALVEKEEYTRAIRAFDKAMILQRWAEGQSDAVSRGDSFAFGRQRDLIEDIERLRWEMESVAAEPVRRANEAKMLAEQVPDRPTAIEHWEDAVQLYSEILSLDWWEHAEAAADDIDLNTEVQRREAVVNLIDTRFELAQNHREEAADAAEPTGELEHYQKAVKHLKRASELTEEVDHEETETIERNLEQAQESLTAVQSEVVETTDAWDESGFGADVTDGHEGDSAAREDDAIAPSADGVSGESDTIPDPEGGMGSDDDTSGEEPSMDDWVTITNENE